jgi:TRAP transporter TAXI family solute receptor
VGLAGCSGDGGSGDGGSGDGGSGDGGSGDGGSGDGGSGDGGSGDSQTSTTSEVYKANFGTAAEGGAFRIIGSGLSEIWNEHEQLDITPITTGGDLDNGARLARGEISYAVNDAYHAWLRVKGQAPYEESFDVNSMFRMFTNQNWFVVREDSGMTHVSDLEGKSVGSGAQGSGANVDVRFFLEEIAGLNIDKRYLSFSDSAQAIANNQLDTMLVYGILPAVQQLAQQTNVRPLKWDDDLLNEALEHPAIRELQFPTFVDWWDEPIPTPAKDIMITCRSDVSEEAAYLITKQTFENIDRAKDVFVLLQALSLEEGPRNVGGDIPLHPGAQRYFEEKGVL